jgi:hypothetical protein
MEERNHHQSLVTIHEYGRKGVYTRIETTSKNDLGVALVYRIFKITAACILKFTGSASWFMNEY